VDDARLVVLNAIDAKEKGARIMTRTAATSARRVDGVWQVEFTDRKGKKSHARAKAVLNAAGPWVEKVINGVVNGNSARRVRLVKGSHIVVPKFWEGPQAYLLQNTDQRVIFVNPYEGDKCLIGTTDIPYDGRPDDVRIGPDEVAYLLAAVNRYMRKELVPGDVVHSFSGVRPLYDDDAENPSAVTRDYVFDIEGSPPLLSVFGGKITTYRKLAEHALQKLQPFFPGMKDDWTANAILPGGDMPYAEFDAYLPLFQKKHPWLPPALAYHYARLYGTRARLLLDGIGSLQGLGRHFGGLLYEAEIDYLKRHEWAETIDDVLDRRTKHRLHLTTAEQAIAATAFS
jgi:D-erythritol 1-phosphate dehydrogenase